jgi:hypothetical protein
MNTTRFLAGALALLAISACETAKSSNPLSPSVAGPIPGVEIGAPKLLEPGAGWTVEAEKQPITLLIENTFTTGQRPLNYLVEVALDSGFGNKVFSREGIAPGEGGRTSVRLPESLASDRTYYWRARAQDGANTGPFSGVADFQVYTPIVLGEPGLVAPGANARISGRTPNFAIRNISRSGPIAGISYTLQVSLDEAFSRVVAQLEVGEQTPETRVTYPGDLDYDTYYFWRVRAYETSKMILGPWSGPSAFMTGRAPVVTPDPIPPGPPTGTPPAGGYPRTGFGVVQYVSDTWPDYRRPVGSLGERQANMAFLRDRIIETGICWGMQLAWNLKRGGPEKSIDYIVQFKDGRWQGVDVAFDYDNTGIWLELWWGEQPDDPFATYGGYSPMPSCK